MDSIPPPLAVVAGIYAVAAPMLTAIERCLAMRDMVLGVTKIDQSAIPMLRIRITALCSSFIPIWKALCVALLILGLILWISIAALEPHNNDWWYGLLLFCGGAISIGAGFAIFHHGGRDIRAMQRALGEFLATHAAEAPLDQDQDLPAFLEGRRTARAIGFQADVAYTTEVFLGLSPEIAMLKRLAVEL